jgi:hypothetical protein
MSAVLKRAGRRRGGWQRRWVLWMLWRQKVRVLLGQTHLSINNVYFSHYLTWAMVIDKRFFKFKDRSFDS